MKNILLLAWLLALLPARAQSLLEPFATRFAALSALAPAFSASNAQEFNPASIARIEKPAVTVSAEHRFLLRELGSSRLHATLPVHSGAAGVGVVSAGSNNWRELALRGTYARRLGSRADIGIGLQWLHVGNGVYGHASALLADAGFRWQLAPGVYAGMHLQNPARSRLGKDPGQRQPARYGLGIAWQREGQWLLAADLEHADGRPGGIVAGAEYVLARAFRARCGIDSAVPAAWLGLAATAARLRIDVSVMLHRELGATPVLLIIYPAQ